jgi:hypothetical protein
MFYGARKLKFNYWLVCYRCEMYEIIIVNAWCCLNAHMLLYMQKIIPRNGILHNLRQMTITHADLMTSVISTKRN